MLLREVSYARPGTVEEAIALADRVVIMSAGPASRVIGDHAIDLARPRDASEVRLAPRFHELHKAIWGQLRAEVLNTAVGQEARNRVVTQGDKQVKAALGLFDRAQELLAQRRDLERQQDRQASRQAAR